MAAEDKVTIGTGQALRNIRVQTVVNGVLTDVLMEVVSISDSNGNVIDFDQKDFNMQLLRKLNLICLYLAYITGNTIPGDNLLEGEV
jgi:hypothetical protein